jgi:hypothetical protein
MIELDNSTHHMVDLMNAHSMGKQEQARMVCYA